MLSIGGAVTHASGGHAPIVIQSNSDFTSCACVVSGNGSTTSPYIIGPWTINNVNGDAVYIDGTSLRKSFEVLNLNIAGNIMSTETGIVLNNYNPSGRHTIGAKVNGVQTSMPSSEAAKQ